MLKWNSFGKFAAVLITATVGLQVSLPASAQQRGQWNRGGHHDGGQHDRGGHDRGQQNHQRSEQHYDGGHSNAGDIAVGVAAGIGAAIIIGGLIQAAQQSNQSYEVPSEAADKDEALQTAFYAPLGQAVGVNTGGYVTMYSEGQVGSQECRRYRVYDSSNSVIESGGMCSPSNGGGAPYPVDTRYFKF